MGTQDELALLHEHRNLWVESLFKSLELTDRAITNARKTYRGSERRTVLEDLNNEADRIDNVLTELLGPAPERNLASDSSPLTSDFSTPVLQLAWSDGRLIAWSAGYKTTPENHELILERLSAHGASASEWAPADDLELPGEVKAPCVSAPIAATLGWLVSLGGVRESDLSPT
ncbi:MAG: hypothetical protein VX725_03175, partial [Actinomycetota bacterium]|nr:hypothetical protein [Actinomycetota bacterium]